MASVSQVKRLFDLLSKLQSDESYTAAELAEQMGVSRRTMFRDLKDLEKLGVRARYNDRLQRYVVSLDEEAISTAQITPTELKSLLSLGQVSVDAVSCVPTKLLAKRIDASPVVPVRSGSVGHQTSISEAILTSQKIAVSLRSGRTLVVQPHRLVADAGVCFLVASSEESLWQGRISLEDILAVDLTGEKFTPLDEKELEELTTAVWAAESTAERAVITFDREVAEAVSGEQRIPGTRFTKLPDGQIRIDKPMTSLRPMIAWVLSFGGSALVESPPSLRTAVMAEWQRVADKYHNRSVSNS